MRIVPLYFIVSVFLTMLVLYIIHPKPRVILKEPSIDREISDTYIDKNKVCYRYHRKEVKCVQK